MRLRSVSEIDLDTIKRRCIQHSCHRLLTYRLLDLSQAAGDFFFRCLVHLHFPISLPRANALGNHLVHLSAPVADSKRVTASERLSAKLHVN